VVTVPSFLLRRLYVKGSLRHTPDGMAFDLLNKLGSGHARHLLPLTVDGKEVPLESTSFVVDGRQVGFKQISENSPFSIALNKTTTVVSRGVKLIDGPHKIAMGFEVAGLGILRFDFTDIVSDA
jgi:hydroxymethylglutaryl-CoA reductase (NADPH)